jgi:hypothetical protein
MEPKYAQLAVFICDCNRSFVINEDILEVIPLHGTNIGDVF